MFISLTVHNTIVMGVWCYIQNTGNGESGSRPWSFLSRSCCPYKPYAAERCQTVNVYIVRPQIHHLLGYSAVKEVQHPY